MDNIIVLGISVSHRRDVSAQIQDILTNNGCKIHARLGLPLQDFNSCSDQGLILIQLICTEEEARKVLTEVNQIDDVKADLMVL
jgi:hypothetical protein